MAAREVTRIIPIVMVGATTPVELGLVNSLARPGGNVTGVTFAALRRTPVDGLIVMTDQVTQIRGDDIVRFAIEMKLATVFGGPARRFVAAGGLISWSADSLAYWRQAATYVDKILRGATPAT